MSDEWLKHLERTVHEASETIEGLRREKRDLEERVEELEGALKKAESKGGKSKKKDAGTDEAARAWQKERQEIRSRVESLTEKLEGLLEESG